MVYYLFDHCPSPHIVVKAGHRRMKLLQFHFAGWPSAAGECEDCVTGAVERIACRIEKTDKGLDREGRRL